MSAKTPFSRKENEEKSSTYDQQKTGREGRVEKAIGSYMPLEKYTPRGEKRGKQNFLHERGKENTGFPQKRGKSNRMGKKKTALAMCTKKRGPLTSCQGGDPLQLRIDTKRELNLCAKRGTPTKESLERKAYLSEANIHDQREGGKEVWKLANSQPKEEGRRAQKKKRIISTQTKKKRRITLTREILERRCNFDYSGERGGRTYLAT